MAKKKSLISSANVCWLTECQEKKKTCNFQKGGSPRTLKFTGWSVWINVINRRTGPLTSPGSIWPCDTLWILQMKRYEGLSNNWPSRVKLTPPRFFLLSCLWGENTSAQGFPYESRGCRIITNSLCSWCIRKQRAVESNAPHSSWITNTLICFFESPYTGAEIAASHTALCSFPIRSSLWLNSLWRTLSSAW